MATHTVYVCSENPGNPVEGAEVVLRRSDGTSQDVRKTNEDGEASFSLTQTAGLQLLVRAPDHEIAFTPHLDDTVMLRPLRPARNRLGWWHDDLGVQEFNLAAGRGIGVGVIDSGCSDHPDIQHVIDCGTVTHAEIAERLNGLDTHGHGTSVLGLLTGRPQRDEHYGGMAPGATVYSFKAFDHKMSSSGTQAEIREAIVYFTHKNVDLINCSFADESPVPTDEAATEDALEEAFERGVLCICAAGNQPRAAQHPARSRWAVSVAAFGRHDTLTPGSWLENLAPPMRETMHWRNKYFLTVFSARGRKIDCAGFGIGIVAAHLPRDGASRYVSVYGTSFATPLVCGLLAAHLSTDQAYLRMPRDAARATYAREKLTELCVDLGFDRSIAGHGLPRLKRHGPPDPVPRPSD